MFRPSGELSAMGKSLASMLSNNRAIRHGQLGISWFNWEGRGR